MLLTIIHESYKFNQTPWLNRFHIGIWTKQKLSQNVALSSRIVTMHKFRNYRWWIFHPKITRILRSLLKINKGKWHFSTVFTFLAIFEKPELTFLLHSWTLGWANLVLLTKVSRWSQQSVARGRSGSRLMWASFCFFQIYTALECISLPASSPKYSDRNNKCFLASNIFL